VLQLHGLETASLNTVQFSNHSGYRQLKGFRTSAQQLADLFAGLKMNGLQQNVDMILTGYVPGEEELVEVGKIARGVKETKGSCFWCKLLHKYTIVFVRPLYLYPFGALFYFFSDWKTDFLVGVLDPVMGDQGRLYVSEGVVPVYKSLLPYADLIVPNQFETEYDMFMLSNISIFTPANVATQNRRLTGITVDSIATLSNSIDHLHNVYHIPHVVITSVTFAHGTEYMKCAGSSMTSTGKPRKFMVDVPIIDGFFSGTGDLFAALTLARLREFSEAAGLLNCKSWIPPDETEALEIPLAKATEVVLGSIHLILEKTKAARDKKLSENIGDDEDEEPDVFPTKAHIRKTRASELRLVQSQKELLMPSKRFEVICFP
jgi:pyridoxine kinase